MTRSDSPTTLVWVSALAGMLFGIIVGYAIAMGGLGPTSRPAPGAGSFGEIQPMGAGAAAPAASPAAPVVTEADLQPWRNILASDPKNVKAAIELANRLYDAGRYPEAIAYYEQAFALDAKNINVSTDLGTAQWYSGKPDAAIAQFTKSLALNATHPQTLFNLGVVLLDGKQDAAGAVAAWEKLVAANPSSPDAAKARQMIEDARTRIVPAPTRSSR